MLSQRVTSPPQAIRLFGTDFSLMERMFPGRPRKALKNKLRREYRADRGRVDAALAGGDDASTAVGKLKEVAGMLRQVRACVRCLPADDAHPSPARMRDPWIPPWPVHRDDPGPRSA